jgi:hypothetical protein
MFVCFHVILYAHMCCVQENEVKLCLIQEDKIVLLAPFITLSMIALVII